MMKSLCRVCNNCFSLLFVSRALPLLDVCYVPSLLTDHDRGVLTLDHISLEEMESDSMRHIENEGHESRMLLAYSRDVLVV
jgi:hypothetical protein